MSAAFPFRSFISLQISPKRVMGSVRTVARDAIAAAFGSSVELGRISAHCLEAS